MTRRQHRLSRGQTHADGELAGRDFPGGAGHDGDGPIEAVIAQAVEDLRRKRFLDGLNADFAALRADPVAWAVEEVERRETEGTLGDGLETE